MTLIFGLCVTGVTGSFLRFVTGKNVNIGCVTGRNFIKIRGKIDLLCHGCHGSLFWVVSRVGFIIFGVSRVRKFFLT